MPACRSAEAAAAAVPESSHCHHLTNCRCHEVKDMLLTSSGCCTAATPCPCACCTATGCQYTWASAAAEACCLQERGAFGAERLRQGVEQGV